MSTKKKNEIENEEILEESVDFFKDMDPEDEDLEAAADALLAEDEAEEKAQKKAGKENAGVSDTVQEQLDSLIKKGKKKGKLTAGELKLLDKLGYVAEYEGRTKKQVSRFEDLPSIQIHIFISIGFWYLVFLLYVRSPGRQVLQFLV